jgi:hypothetical protein
MGWIHEHDSAAGRLHCEGYVVGYVPRNWTPPVAPVPTLGVVGKPETTRCAAAWATAHVPLSHALDSHCRELGSHAVDHKTIIQGVRLVGAACDCGWRSPRRMLGSAVEWSPSSVHCEDYLAELLERLWRAHVAAECGATKT